MGSEMCIRDRSQDICCVSSQTVLSKDTRHLNPNRRTLPARLRRPRRVAMWTLGCLVSFERMAWLLTQQMSWLLTQQMSCLQPRLPPVVLITSQSSHLSMRPLFSQATSQSGRQVGLRPPAGRCPGRLKAPRASALSKSAFGLRCSAFGLAVSLLCQQPRHLLCQQPSHPLERHQTSQP